MANASVAKDPGLPSHRLSLMTYNVSDTRTGGPRTSSRGLPPGRPKSSPSRKCRRKWPARFADLKGVYRHQFIVEPGARLNSEVYAGDETLAILSIHPITAEGGRATVGTGKALAAGEISLPGAESPGSSSSIHRTRPSPSGLPPATATFWISPELIAELEGPVIVAGDFNVNALRSGFPAVPERQPDIDVARFPGNMAVDARPAGHSHRSRSGSRSQADQCRSLRPPGLGSSRPEGRNPAAGVDGTVYAARP